MSLEVPTEKEIPKIGHFRLEAKGKFVPGTIVLPGHVPMSPDIRNGVKAYPGITIKWEDHGGRRVFDVLAAATDFGQKLSASTPGFQGQKERKAYEKEFIREIIRFLETSEYWQREDIVLWRSPEEIGRERDMQTADAVPTDHLIESLQRRGELPSGDIDPDTLKKNLREFLLKEAHGTKQSSPKEGDA